MSKRRLNLFMEGVQKMAEHRKRVKENKQETNIKDSIRSAVIDEFDRFMDLLFRNKTILFQDFLDNTSVYFDSFIQNTCKKEKLKFIAGKFLMQIESPVKVHLIAEFYFQTTDQQWILKRKEGNIDSDHFTDWKTASELQQLQRECKLEFPIEPPGDSR